MGASTIKSGELVTLQELNTSSPFFAHGNSLRVIGKLQEYSVETSSATIVEGNAKLKIDTQHLRDINFRIDSIYQFIGELHLLPGNEVKLFKECCGLVLGEMSTALTLIFTISRCNSSDSFGRSAKVVAAEVGKQVVVDGELLAAFGTDDYFLAEADVYGRNGP